MATFSNNLNLGLANLADVTAANSANNGAGDAFSAVSNTGGTVRSLVGASYDGSDALEIVANGGSANNYVEYNITGTQTSMRMYYKHSLCNNYKGHIYGVRNSAGTIVAGIRISETSLVVDESGSTQWTGYWGNNTHPVLTVGEWYRIEGQFNINTGAGSNGTARVRLYDISGTLIDEMSASSNSNHGTDQIASVRFGRHKTENTNHTAVIDNLAVTDTFTWIGAAAGATTTTTSTTTTTTTAAPTTTTSTTTTTTTASTTTTTTTAAPTTTTTTSTTTTTTTWTPIAPTVTVPVPSVTIPKDVLHTFEWSEADADTIPYNGAHWNIGAVNGGFGFGGMFANYTPAASHVTIRVDILHTSGTFSGAGLRLSTAEPHCWDFHETIGNPSPGTYYRLTKTIPASTSTPYFFSNYGGSASPFFSPVTAKEMTVYGLHIRDATAAEIATPVDSFEVIDLTQVGRNESFGAQNANPDFSAWPGAVPDNTFGWSDGPDKVVPQAFSRTVTRTSGPGTAPTLTSPSDTSRTGTWTEAGTHVYEVVVTDGQGLQSAPGIITINVSSPVVKPTAVESNSGWTAVGNPNIVTCVTDDVDGTYAQSPSTTGSTSIRFDLPPLGEGPAVIKTRDSVAPGSVRKRTVDIYEGSTWIAGREINPLPETPTTHAWTMTPTELAKITDRANLSLVITDEAI